MSDHSEKPYRSAPSISDAPTVSGRDANVAAPSIVAPQTRDLAELSSDLTAWLRQKMPEADNLRVSDLAYPLGAGMSHETILFDVHWQDSAGARSDGMVVRIKPMRRQVYLDDMFEQQFQLMQLMHASGAVPVAEPLWMEHDADLLSAPFFVMKKMQGRVAVSFPPYSKQGWLFDATPAEQRRLWEDSVRKLAAIQTVPVSEAQFLQLPGEFTKNFDQETDRWSRYLDWVDPEHECKLLRQQFERLLDLRPANRVEGIVWGDARLGNMMVDDDYRVVAVMDWEQPSLGGALQDLGWWLYTERMQTIERGLATLPGMGAREETIALWSEVCGKPAVDIEWYEAFAAFKMDCLAVRMLSVGTLPAAAAHEPGLRTQAMLAQLSA